MAKLMKYESPTTVKSGKPTKMAVKPNQFTKTATPKKAVGAVKVVPTKAPPKPKKGDVDTSHLMTSKHFAGEPAPVNPRQKGVPQRDGLGDVANQMGKRFIGG